MANGKNKFAAAHFIANRPVVIRITGQNALRATVVHYDASGYWLVSDDLAQEIVKAWKADYSGMKTPVVFVPMHRVEWVMTAQTR